MSCKRPAPKLRELITVVPIGQTQVHDGVTVMMLALELYADGFVLTFRALSDAPMPIQHPEEYASLDVRLVATDASGTMYDDEMVGANLYLGAEGWEGRFIRRLAPALDPATKRVRFEVPNLHWFKRIPDPPFQVPAVEMTGPWTFTVVLPV